MIISLLAVGTRMPSWVEQGYQEYARRLPSHCRLKLVEIEPARRGRSGSPERWRQQEGKRLIAAIPNGDRVIALDVEGRSWSSTELAGVLDGWLASGRNLSLLVGGADGLTPESLQCAEQHWSLSPLTLPHPLVRVVVAEQLYRAWTIVNHHPYHRG